MLIEFEDYSSYFGARLYPRVGSLALLGVGFILVFGVLDWLTTSGDGPFWIMLLHRTLAAVVLAIAAIILMQARSGWGAALVTLYLGILSFLLLTMNAILYTRHLEYVAFTMVFFFFGVHALAPLLRIRDYAVASVLTLVAVGLLMEVPDMKAPDYFLAGLFAIPLQVFLGAALVASQKAAREHYELARQNYLFSSLDTLTQLLNRRTWYEHTETCLRERRAGSGTLSFLMLDIDHFKMFNDTWGHDCGDAVIRAVSAQLVAQTRVQDVVGRLGGEEFGILLPDADEKGAQETAERIRSAIEALSVTYRDQALSVTVSVGVASTPCPDLDTLIKRGDEALYQAKKDGRNRIAVATTEGARSGGRSTSHPSP